MLLRRGASTQPRSPLARCTVWGAPRIGKACNRTPGPASDGAGGDDEDRRRTRVERGERGAPSRARCRPAPRRPRQVLQPDRRLVDVPEPAGAADRALGPDAFVRVVGVVEMAGPRHPHAPARYGGYAMAAWLLAIALNLATTGRSWDLAVRDVEIAALGLHPGPADGVASHPAGRGRQAGAGEPVATRPRRGLTGPWDSSIPRRRRAARAAPKAAPAAHPPGRSVRLAQCAVPLGNPKGGASSESDHPGPAHPPVDPS